MRFVLISVLFCWVLSNAYAQPLNRRSIDTLLEIRGGILAFHDKTQPEPVALLRVGRVHKDYQRKGFFRIGALPVVAMDDVSVEIPDPKVITNGLSQLQAWLCSHDKHALELRRLKFQVGSYPTNRVESGSASISHAGKWDLTDGVVFYSGTNRVSVEHGTLQVTGDRPGELILNSIPPLATNIFNLQIPSEPNQKDHL